MNTALFPLSRCGITPGAKAKLESSNTDPVTLLMRHQSGDWQEMSAHNRVANREAVKNGYRVFSAYALAGTARVYCHYRGGQVVHDDPAAQRILTKPPPRWGGFFDRPSLMPTTAENAANSMRGVILCSLLSRNDFRRARMKLFKM